MRESELQKLVQLEASKKGARLWRNNMGATYDDRGNFIRYGLANESVAVNRELKSGDLIGITPVIITQDMVGMMVGVFTSYEVKRPGWVYSGRGREMAQEAWCNLIRSLGGIAKFISNQGEV